jgi:CHAT domain-containing protein
LRRALLLAGSESQVMSLWRVSDEDTHRFMADYYRRLQAGSGRGAALQQTQWALLKDHKLAHPYFWAAFIQSGEWRSLAGRSAQPKVARRHP